MAKVTERCRESNGRPVFICDFSPPRGGDPALLEGARLLNADFLCVAYNPSKSVRADSAMVAHAIKQQMGRDVLFTLATRDMNKLAIQSHLLGASLLGLENVIVVGGDSFTERELTMVRAVNDFRSTELIAAIKSMNRGVDFRGLKLRGTTDFCVGATVDLGKGIEREARLAQQKAAAGTDFLVTQPVYSVDQVEQFRRSYDSGAEEGSSSPIFVGLQVLQKGCITFSPVPEDLRQELEGGRPGPDISIELLHGFLERGITNIYLVSPILRSGRRDYGAAQRVLEAAREL